MKSLSKYMFEKAEISGKAGFFYGKVKVFKFPVKSPGKYRVKGNG